MTTSGRTSSTSGPNVLIFDPSMSAVDDPEPDQHVYAVQQNNQFGPARYALLFKPGTYNVDVPVGFYTQVLGLGQSPDEVVGRDRALRRRP